MKLLLDEHVSPAVAKIVRKISPDIEIVSIHHWRDGQFINQPDERILRAAAIEGLVLVSFDVNTIPPVISEFANSGESHAGVIFVSIRTFAQNDVKGLARALVELVSRHGGDSWANRVDFLTRA
jgi:hypothetical protein